MRVNFHAMCPVCLSDIKQIWSFISGSGECKIQEPLDLKTRSAVASGSSASATLNRRSASMWMRLETPSADVPFNNYVIAHCLSCFSLHLFPSSFSHSIFITFSIVVSFVLPLCSTQFADSLKLGYSMFTYFASGVTQCSPPYTPHLFVMGRPNSTEQVPDSSAGVLTRNKTHCE
jgi:hypothetical protein